MPSSFSNLEGLLVEALLLLARLLGHLERRLTILLRRLTRCLLLLLLIEVQLCCSLPSLLAKLECRLLDLLLLEAPLNVLAFSRLAELLFCLPGSIVLLRCGQAKLRCALPCLLPKLIRLGIKLLAGATVGLVDFKGRLLELLLCLPRLLFLLLGSETKLCCALPRLFPELKRSLSKLLLKGLSFHARLECLLTELFLRLTGRFLLLLCREAKVGSPLTRLLSSLKGLDRHLLLRLPGLLGGLKCRLAKALRLLPSLILSLPRSETELCLS